MESAKHPALYKPALPAGHPPTSQVWTHADHPPSEWVAERKNISIQPEPNLTTHTISFHTALKNRHPFWRTRARFPHHYRTKRVLFEESFKGF